MKNKTSVLRPLSFVLSLVFSLVATASSSFPLANGLNTVNAAGEIAALEGATVSASQAVTLKAVYAVTEYTNAYLSVSTIHPRYDFTVTNFDGNAAIATNVLDHFSYADWIHTNGVSKIVGNVLASRTNIVTRGASYQLPKATYTVTNDLISASASAHKLTATPGATKFFAGNGKLLLSAGDADNLSVIIK